MSKVTPTLLNDTLNLIQLARETALANGKLAQAQRLSPVVNEMRILVTSAREPQSRPAPVSGIMAQNDFRTLLEAAKGSSSAGKIPQASSTERIQMVSAMAAGNMSDVDIARQLGMTREEVRLVLSVGQKTRSVQEVQG